MYKYTIILRLYEESLLNSDAILNIYYKLSHLKYVQNSN